jgi:putative transposase
MYIKDSRIPPIKERRSIRLEGYDYSSPGACFITICARAKTCFFSRYPALGSIVTSEWESMQDRFPPVRTDMFVVMPNHVHGILFLTTYNVGATLEVAHRAGSSPAPTLGRVIGAYKSISMKRWSDYLKESVAGKCGSFWQRNYYERVIRNEHELNLAREYIMFNPVKWSFDGDNPDQIIDTEYSKKWQWLEGD